MTVKIDFTSYKDMRFGRWVDWVKSGKSAIEYFGGVDLEKLEDYHTLDIQNLAYWLESLNEPPDIDLKPTSIMQKTYRQRIDALKVCKLYKNSMIEVLPILLAIFEQPANTYTWEIEPLVEKWKEVYFIEAYQKSMGWLLGLQNYETYMSQNLKKISYTPEQIKAGVKEFEKFGEYNTYNSLAGGDFLKHEQVLKQSLEKISEAICYANLQTWYEKEFNNNQLAEMRAKQKNIK
jgi:hypothetical protein